MALLSSEDSSNNGVMRVIQIGSFPVSDQLISGGVESSIYGLALEQAKGQDVFVFDFPRREFEDCIETIGALTIYRYRNKGAHNKDAIGRIPEIVEQMLKLNPSVCHIHGTSLFSWKVFDALNGKGIPTMLTVHGLVKEEKRKSLKNRFSFKTLYQLWTQTSAERKLLQSTSNAIVDTQYVVDQIGRYRLRSKPKLTVIPQGIDDVFFDLSCSRDSRMILSVGVFSPRKGHLLTIQAFERVSKQIPHATLTICGIVSDEAYFKEVEEYVKASPCKDKISFLTNLPKDQLLTLYEQAHVFALHSQEESQGIVLAEAMAVGLPVVATNVGGIPYVVDNGETGLLSDYGDVSAFSRSLQILMTDCERWKVMSDNCRKTASYYSWTNIASSVIKLYDKAINERD